MTSLNSALINIRRAPYQSLVAVLLLTVTFFISYFFSFFAFGSEKILQYFETRPQVIAFFTLDTKADTINSLAKELTNQSYVSGVKIVSKDEALKMYQDENKDDPLLLELVTSQILPASIEVSAKSLEDLKKIKEQLSKSSAVDEVVLQEDILASLSKWTTTIRLIGFAAIGILATLSLLLMIIIIGMKVVIKRPAITIMRIIGASRGFIRKPFLLEGLLYGLISSVLGWLASLATLFYLTPDIHAFLGPIPLFPIDPAFFALQLGSGTLIGMVLGTLAGWIAVTRVMRK